MKQLIKHKYYLISFFFCFIAGVLYSATNEKKHLLFFFAENRTDFWDHFFIYITKASEWSGYLFFTLLLLFFHYGKALFVGVTALLSAIATLSFKWFFSRPRPAIQLNELELIDFFTPVQDIALHTGLTSFPSGHALAGFALCTYLALISRPNPFLGLLFLLLAWGIGLSRVYLGHHFFEDVMAGSVIGFLSGLCAWILFRKYGQSFDKKLSFSK